MIYIMYRDKTIIRNTSKKKRVGEYWNGDNSEKFNKFEMWLLNIYIIRIQECWQESHM